MFTQSRMTLRRSIATILSVVFATVALLSACHTAHGVKQDTKSAVRHTGHGIKKAGEKVENAGKK